MISQFQFNLLLTFMFIAAWMRIDDRVEIFFALFPHVLYSLGLGLFFLAVTWRPIIGIAIRLFGGARAILWYLKLDNHVRMVYGEYYQIKDDE